jgi:hypothetical protein
MQKMDHFGTEETRFNSKNLCTISQEYEDALKKLEQLVGDGSMQGQAASHLLDALNGKVRYDFKMFSFFHTPDVVQSALDALNGRVILAERPKKPLLVTRNLR